MTAWLLVAIVLGLLSIPAAGVAAPAKVAYIVAVSEEVDVGVAAAATGVTPIMMFTEAFHGYVAELTMRQYNRVVKEPSTVWVEVEASYPVSLPTATAVASQPAQFVSNGVRRVGGLASPTARIDGVDERIDVDVAIIDSGIDVDHPDLNVAGGVNCATSSKKMGFNDTQGHGTMVAGFVGAIDNSFGAVGIAPGARVWAVRVLVNGPAINERQLLCGLDWVVANADVIEIANMSLGGWVKSDLADCASPDKKQALRRAVCKAVEAGVVVVVSAGNESDDIQKGYEPGWYPEVITVSALSDNDGLPGGLGGALTCLPSEVDDTFATFSNYGFEVDLAAPGSCISSTYIDGLYAVASGTSFSAPLVSGAAALYLANHPDATPAEVRQALLDAAEPGPIPGDPDAYPEGILNVSKL